jgi:phosphotriesterase-related protein
MKQETGLKTVNTVLGPLETSKIGFALMHDHILGATGGIPQVYPELLGKDYKQRIVNGLNAAKQAGINTIVDADTFDLGRAVKILAEVSQISGVNIICCSGWYLELPIYLGNFTADQFAQIFTREVREGIEGTNIKAGILKSAADFGGVTPNGQLLLRGVARAQLTTGVPIMLHSYAPDQIGRQQLAILKEEGVDLRRVKVDHLPDTTDLEYIIWVAEQGCYLGMDRLPGIHVPPLARVSSEGRVKTIKALIDAGYANRILLGHDTFLVSSFFDTLPDTDKKKLASDNPHGFLYINKFVLPKLRESGVSEKIIKSICVDNPRRFFEGNPN